MSERNMAIAVIGFDGYNDIWKDFFTLFHKYWPGCPYKIYLINNELDYKVKGVTTLHAGADAEWSRKVQMALEWIEEDYICLLLEDFYLGKEVQTRVVAQALKLMEKDKLKYYKLHTFTPFRTEHYKGYKHLYVIPENMDYGISLLAGIWEKGFLREKVGTENYNAWKFECNRLAEEKGKTNTPLKGCVYDERNILNIVHGVVQGKYLPEAVRYFARRGYALNQSRRRMLNPWENFIDKCKRFNWPGPVKKILKKILKLFGMKFVTDENA